MVDWQAMEGIGGLATAVAVIVALAFGVVQVRLQAAQRRDVGAAQFLSTMLTPEFIDALDRVSALPDDAPPEMIKSDPAMRRAVLLVDFTYETAGWMVYERVVPLHVVDRVIGGITRTTWKKVRAYTLAVRRESGGPSAGEWWQWLVERMDADPTPGKAEGAHMAFRGWRA